MAFTKTSFICLMLMIYMGYFHFSRKRLPLKTTLYFNAYFVSATIVTLFDYITLITVNKMDAVPAFINNLAHTIYILSINIMMFFLFLYVQCYLKRNLVISKKRQILQSLPMTITSLMILIAPVNYVQGKYTNYASGPKVYSLYLAVIFYNIVLIYYGFHCMRELEREKRIAIVATIPLFIAVSIVSFIYPEGLLVILYVILSAAGLLLTGENMDKYTDKQTGMFNQYALEIVADEFIALNKHRVAAIFSISEVDHMNPSISWKSYLGVMKKLQNFCIKEFGRQVYRIGDNGFVLLETSKATANDSAHKVIDYANTLSHGFDMQYNILSLCEHTNRDDFMSDIADTCMDALNKAANFDFLTGIRNRNSYEKIITTLRNENVDATYFIADVNNLKQTNDILGHSAGDNLLQSVAKVFKDSVKEHGWVFRMGGDEFVVLLKDIDISTFLEELEKNRKEYNKDMLFPISFAIGYGQLLDPDGIETADKMMYENKKKMKERIHDSIF